jgi:dihydroxyacid dehydratase/phosphogluconate dehydratase
VELTMRGHCYDAIVGLAGCDKSLPGMMMSMVRLNVPSIFIYGGSILPGSFRGRQITIQDVFEAVGQHSVGDMSDEDLLESNRSPVRRPAPAVPSSPPTRWRLWPKRSVWLCLIPAARRPLRNP